MSDGNGLPSNWVRVPLGELGDWYGGGTPSKANEKFWSNGKVPWFSPKDMKAFRLQSSEDRITRAAVDSSSVDVFPPDTVLMVVRSGILAHTFPVAVAGVEATMNQDLKGVAPKDGVDATYLAYALRGSGRDILNQCSKAGTTVASIDTLALHRYPVPLAPTNEQQRVVEKLDELLSDLDAGTAALERARANLKRFRAAVLKAAVEGRLTEKWRAAHPNAEPAGKLLERILAERRKKWEEAQLKKYAEKKQAAPKGWKDKYEEPAKLEVASLAALPAGWCWTNLAQLRQWAIYGPRFPSSAYAEDGCLVLRTTDFSDEGVIDLQSPPRISLSKRDYSKYKAEPGDLLITRTGSLGTLAVFQGGAKAIAGAFLLHYRLAVDLTTVWYVNHFLRSPIGNRKLLDAGRGIGRPNLNMPTVERIPIPLPPLNEQLQINTAIESAFSLLAKTEFDARQSAQRSASLRQSILKRAFEGKLVPQDPQDEPASKLLARIRAERLAGKGRPVAVGAKGTGVRRGRKR